jgi:hypothetical protein
VLARAYREGGFPQALEPPPPKENDG